MSHTFPNKKGLIECKRRGYKSYFIDKVLHVEIPVKRVLDVMTSGTGIRLLGVDRGMSWEHTKSGILVKLGWVPDTIKIKRIGLPKSRWFDVASKCGGGDVTCDGGGYTRYIKVYEESTGGWIDIRENLGMDFVPTYSGMVLCNAPIIHKINNQGHVVVDLRNKKTKLGHWFRQK